VYDDLVSIVSMLVEPIKQTELDRRKPGQSRLTTPRNEADAVEILSGVSPDGLTLGTPIGMLVRLSDINQMHCYQCDKYTTSAC
jgi:chorismate synthase